MTDDPVTFTLLSFQDLPGWQNEDHLAAFHAFQISCRRLIDVAQVGSGYQGSAPSKELLAKAECAVSGPDSPTTADQARAFFERHFRPHRVSSDQEQGLLTGYYEPVLEGVRTRTDDYCTPLFRRPSDLVNLVSQVKAKIRGYLVVSRPAGVQCLADVANSFGQRPFDVHVHIFKAD